MATIKPILLLGGATLRGPWMLLGAALLALSVTFVYLLLSRRGEAKALSRCALLSVWAHLILLGGAYLIDGFPAPLTEHRQEGTITVRWMDGAEVTEADVASEARSETPPFDQVTTERKQSDEPVLPDNMMEDAQGVMSQAEFADHSLLPADEPSRAGSTGLSEAPTPRDDTPLSASVIARDIGSDTPSDGPEESPADSPKSVREDDATPSTESTAVVQEIEQAPANSEMSLDEMSDSDLDIARDRSEETIERDAEMLLAETALSAPSAAASSSETGQVPDEMIGTNHEEPVRATAALPSPHVDASEDPATTAGWSAVASPAKPDAFRPPRTLRPPHPTEQTHQVPQRYQGRRDSQRLSLALANGGSHDTEAAVQASLGWLASAQNASGSWSASTWQGGRETREFSDGSPTIRADTALTGLALLAFLGAGETHQQGGRYQQVVNRGLAFLISSQSPQTGDLAGASSRYVAMYCHGIATLALGEAYAMTGDPALRQPLERAIAFTLAAQNRQSGGWRYQPGDLGDTSQFGWQVMALASAEAGGVAIPDAAWRGAKAWLRRASLGDHGGLACYSLERRVPSPSMTAEALVCRVLLDPQLGQATREEAADYVSVHASRADAYADLYLTYYVTLALYPLKDTRWKQWNERMTARLLQTQRKAGSLEGSWDPNTKWGPTGGRVYTTAMACLCLETYYRYLPVYELAATRGSNWSRR